MADKLLEPSQLISGVAILLSFLAGYKYGLSNSPQEEETKKQTRSSDAPKVSCGQTMRYLWKLKTDFIRFIRLQTYSDRGELKMILVVRNDLKMGKGKIGAQCGHAAVGAYQKAVQKSPDLLRRWEDSGCAKVAVKVENEAEMMGILRAARERNLNTCLIRDAGRTQIEPNSKTVLAIGPALCRQIDEVTGHLKLL